MLLSYTHTHTQEASVEQGQCLESLRRRVQSRAAVPGEWATAAAFGLKQEFKDAVL